MIGRERAPAVLLDTCAVIWLANGDPMAAAAIEAIFHAGTVDGIFISAISAWEIGLICRPGRRRSAAFTLAPKIWFERVMAGPGVVLAPLTPEIAIDASFLMGRLHNDPADRLIIATARYLGVP